MLVQIFVRTPFCVIKIDKGGRLGKLAGKADIFALLLLAVPFWGASFLLNTPLLIISGNSIYLLFRNGIYLFVFLTGYYLFSRDEIIETLEKFRFPLLASGAMLGVVEVRCFCGQNFSAGSFLGHPLTNLYAWIMMLAMPARQGGGARGSPAA
jgi:hypothetical protein